METIVGYQDLVNNLQGLFNRSKAILTTRHIVAGYKHVKSFRIEGLQEKNSLKFLRNYAKRSGEVDKIVSQIDEEKLVEIHHLTGGLPLAMELVVGRLRNYSLESVFRELRRINYEVIKNPTSTDDDIYQEFYRFMYQDSWEKLSEIVQELLVGLGVFDLNEGALFEDLIYVSELSAAQVENTTSELINFSLIYHQIQGTHQIFFLYPSTQLFIQLKILRYSIMDNIDFKQVEKERGFRHAEYYLEEVKNWSSVFTNAKASDIFQEIDEFHRGNIDKAIARLSEPDQWDIPPEFPRDFSLGIYEYYEKRSRWQEYIKLGNLGLKACEELSDSYSLNQAYPVISNNIGLSYRMQGNYEEAIKSLMEGISSPCSRPTLSI